MGETEVVGGVEANAAPTTKTERGPDVEVVFVTSKGYGIRTTLSEFRITHRASKGTRAMFVKEESGKLVGAKVIKGDDDYVMILTKNGQANMFKAEEIRKTGRGLKGVKLITLDEGDEVVAVL